MVARLFGCPVHVAAVRERAYLAADAIHTIGFGWSAGYIDAARCVWRRLFLFANSTDEAFEGGELRIRGYVVRKFLDSVDKMAHMRYRSKHPDGPARVTDAQGASARSGAAASLRFLSDSLSFPISVDSASVRLVPHC